MRVHLIHGIHSEHGGATALLKPYFEREGFECAVYDYGWATGIFSRFHNGQRARTIARQVGPDDILVAHSNGGTLSWMVQDMVPVAGLVLIHPALDEDVSFPRARWVDVYHCDKDLVVEASEVLGFWDGLGIFSFLKNNYGRLGRVGYQGKDRQVVSIDDEKLTIDMVQIPEGEMRRLPPVTGHSEMFERTHIDAWGAFYARRARLRTMQLREQDIVG